MHDGTAGSTAGPDDKRCGHAKQAQKSIAQLELILLHLHPESLCLVCLQFVNLIAFQYAFKREADRTMASTIPSIFHSGTRPEKMQV